MSAATKESSHAPRPTLQGVPSGVDIDELSGRDLAGADLRGRDLSRARLAGACLAGADLRDAILFEADLSGAELLGANLAGANLTGCNARSACFGNAELERTNLFGADLRGATLSGAKAHEADFRTADLRGARAVGVDLRGADLERADLRDAILRRSDVAGTRFDRADFSGACLRELEHGADASWIESRITDVDFCGAYMLRRTILDQNFLHEFRARNPVVYWIWWLTSDCGRSLLRWGGCTMSVVLVFGVVFGFTAVDYGVHETWLSPYYFSMVTLTSLGYGDVVPMSAQAQAISMVEVALGYMMLGGMLSIFSNKMARRAD